MPRRQKVVETYIEEESETQEQPEMPTPAAQSSETVKPKKVLSEAQLLNLERAREAASIKKRQIKEQKDKANLLEHEQVKLKAMQYDQVKAKQQEMVQPVTKAKKMVKKVIEVEESESDESEYEEVVVKKRVGRPRVQTVPEQHHHQQQAQYNHLLYQSAQETIQKKIMEERAKNLCNVLMPRC